MKHLLQLVVGGFVAGLIAWGATSYAVADHSRRIERLESLTEVVIDLRAQVRFLVEAEQRRQRRGVE